MTGLFVVLLATAAAVAGAILGYFTRQQLAKRRAGTIEARLAQRLEEVKADAKEIVFGAKEKAAKILEEVKAVEREREGLLAKAEARLEKRERQIEQETAELEKETTALEEERLAARKLHEEAERLQEEASGALGRVANMTQAEAKAELMRQAEQLSREDLSISLSKLERNRQEEIERRAAELMAMVLQRYSRTHAADVTASVVALPSDELKGRIIGREGRNIRTLERLTGVDVIVDETPGAITISAFDPVRREIARTAIEKLIQDGRIQPAKIEEKVEEAKHEINERIRKAGEAAMEEVGIFDLPKEMVHLLGRLAFRTSFGQNALLHSIEVAHVASMLARELGARVDIAKKGALLHDIGKAVDHEIEGTHLELGRKILTKYGMAEDVIRAMQCHHDDYKPEIIEAYIVNAADAISAARPGARRDSVENYLRRLAELERIALSFEGVEKCYAIQAGREVRVFVEPAKIDDLGALKLAREVATKIESEVKYPGEIKVNVIRETRAIEYAR